MSTDLPARAFTPRSLAQRGTQLRPARTGTTRTELSGRVLVAAGTVSQHSYPALIDAEAAKLDTTGMVVAGADWVTTTRRIRAMYLDLFIMCDPPESGQLAASAEHPFPTPQETQDTLLPPPAMNARIQAQIDAGASLAFTPTGYLRAGDRLALRAVITEANLLERDDVVVLLPLDHTWLTQPALKTVIAAIERSHHPVAITLGDANGDPMSRRGVLAGARTLSAMDSPPMFHKTDLVGFHLMARGALAASIGVIASKRRAQIPDKASFAPRANRGANVLLTDLLRFRRSLDMQDQWFASRNAPTCACPVCNGQPIDRFGSEDYDCTAAAQHNAIGLVGYINDAQAHGGYASYWPAKVHDALVAHVAMSQYVGTQIDAPAEVKAWDESSTAVPGH